MSDRAHSGLAANSCELCTMQGEGAFDRLTLTLQTEKKN